MMTIWYSKESPHHNPSCTRDFHIGSCPIGLGQIGNVTMAQADGHELNHILETYPFLKERLKMRPDNLLGYVSSPVAQFYGSDAQYAAGAFLCYRSVIKPDTRV